MDRIDVLIAHHSMRSFAAAYPSAEGTATEPLTPAYIAARNAFWLTLGGFAGFVYSYGWLVR
jgi:hypothetical protein